MTVPIFAQVCVGGFVLRIQVVPGASRSHIVGLHGDRLKVRIAAPPEDGKANAELTAILKAWCGGTLTVIAGHTNRLKTVQVTGIAMVPSLADETH